jgi:hypothetical protein
MVFTKFARCGLTTQAVLTMAWPRVGGPHRLLPAFLRAAVDVLRRDRVVLDVKAVLVAREHVVGRDMHDRDAGLHRPGGQDRGCERIDRPGCRDVALGLVDGGIGPGRDDRVPALLRHRPLDGCRVGEVERVSARRM